MKSKHQVFFLFKIKKFAMTLLLLFAMFCHAACQTKSSSDAARMQWWRNAKFGMFIHWGVYSVPAGVYKGQPVDGVGEWIMEKAKIPIPEYEQFAKQFNPEKFNADEWVRIAKQAGIKYIVITAKHHDGFCLWNSNVTSYDIMHFTPFKRDILSELSQACKKAGIHLGFYYSIMDWHQPDAKSKAYPHQNNPNPDFNTYREEYLKPQLTELIKRYNPEILWFDGEWIPEWTEQQGKDLYQYLRGLKPSLIINNRIGKLRNGMQGMSSSKDAVGDFGTPEQEILKQKEERDWESCMTMNDTWGFKQNDTNWKSATSLILNLIDIAVKGGNYLLNVGPNSEGTIPKPSVDRLLQIGDWLKINGEAIYGSIPVRFKETGDVVFTSKRDGSYLFGFITKPAREVKITSVWPEKKSKIFMLGIKNSLKWRNDKNGVIVQLPSDIMFKHAWVLKIKPKKGAII